MIKLVLTFIIVVDSGIDGTTLLSEYFDENIQKELVPRIKDRITLKKVLHELK